MSQWTALFLIVVVLALDKHIMAWISLRRTMSAEKIAEHERERAEAEERRAGLDKLEAEAKQITAQLEKRTAERIAAMSADQVAAYQRAIAKNCESCRYRPISAYSFPRIRLP